MTSIADTFDSFGVLEHILSFVPAQDLLAATEVSRRFKVAGRSDFLWEEACVSLWKGRKGMRVCEENVSHTVRERSCSIVYSTFELSLLSPATPLTPVSPVPTLVTPFLAVVVQ